MNSKLNFRTAPGNSTYTITKEFHFSYSHQLHGLPDDHPCGRIHGHNGILVVELRSNELDNSGFVIDYRKLDPLKKWIDGNVDHRHLNDVFDFQPTSENLSRFFYEMCQGFGWPVCRVGWSETPKTFAWYEEE